MLWKLFTTVDSWLGIPIAGVGFVVTLALITLIGFLASNFLARRLLDWVDELLEKLPGVRLLYTGIKDVTGAFVGEKKRFQQPVMVTLDPGGGVQGDRRSSPRTRSTSWASPITSRSTCPFSYSFAGQLLLFPRDRVVPLTAPSSKVMAFVVSGGVADVGAG